jgi:zona occludens toxin
MITLITGAPGAGKSAALVKLLSELAKGRAIFVDGIPDLKVPHVALEDARAWPTAVPDGAAVVIDEVQRVWRPAGAGQRVPDDIALLETHRHRGIDFFIVTQHPKLVHANVRNLVGRHIHLRDIGVLGRWWYEWPEAVDPGTWRSAPVKKRYRLDRKVFALYKSASEHIKPVRSFPPALWLLVVALIGAAYYGWQSYAAIQRRGEGIHVPSAVGGSGSGKSVGAAPRAGAVQSPLTGAQMALAFTPRLSNDPGSAPAYDHLRVVRVMPRVVGGFCRDGVCRCFTQQGTDPAIGNEACRAWIASPPFDAYREVVNAPSAAPARAVGPEGGESAAGSTRGQAASSVGS